MPYHLVTFAVSVPECGGIRHTQNDKCLRAADSTYTRALITPRQRQVNILVRYSARCHSSKGGTGRSCVRDCQAEGPKIASNWERVPEVVPRPLGPTRDAPTTPLIPREQLNVVGARTGPATRAAQQGSRACRRALKPVPQSVCTFRAMRATRLRSVKSTTVGAQLVITPSSSSRTTWVLMGPLKETRRRAAAVGIHHAYPSTPWRRSEVPRRPSRPLIEDPTRVATGVPPIQKVR